MTNIFGKAFLAAAIGLSALAAIPATASADEVIVIRDGWHHGGWRDRYERRYEYRPHYQRYEGPRYGYYARPWHHHHVRCFENRWGRMICER